MPSLFLGGWKGFSQGESSFGSAGKRIEPISLIGLIKQLFIVPPAHLRTLRISPVHPLKIPLRHSAPPERGKTKSDKSDLSDKSDPSDHQVQSPFSISPDNTTVIRKALVPSIFCIFTIPRDSHNRQTAIGKCSIPNTCHAIRNGDTRQTTAHKKRPIPNTCHAIRNGNTRQTTAPGKRGRPNHFNIGRYRI